MSAVPRGENFTLSELSSVLADNLSPVLYPAGSLIFRQGEPAGCAYFIEQGSVQIIKNGDPDPEVIAVLEAGALLGEMAPIDEDVRSATAVTLEETRVVPISKVHLQDLLGAANPLVQLLVRELLQRLRNTKETTTKVDAPEEDAKTGNLAGAETNQSIRGRAVGYLKLERELRDGLKRREFELHFQPIVRLSDCGIAGYEALVRWRSPKLGFVQPGTFISTAEDSGLIVPIGLWVLEHACHLLHRFQARCKRCFPDLPPLFMSVNVCARQLLLMRDVENMISTIKETGIKPEQLKLEITEGILVEDPVLASSGLGKLKEIGVSLAIDDFGTGYSSLSYLNRFPIDTLKIDRSFVSSMLHSKSSLKIVQAVTTLAEELDMDIVAEGVEQADEANALAKLGSQFAQGYLFSKPKSLNDTMEFLDTPSAWHAHVESLGLK